MFSEQLLTDYDRDGFVVARGVFDATEVADLTDHYMALRSAGSYPFDMVADVPRQGDPLVRFPRMIHMHRFDEVTRNYLLDQRITALVTQLLQGEPYAVQSMLYFKPPGARGQALHQDNMYLQVKPGTCMAAWTALDRCHEANGCMVAVPGSHRWPIICPVEADSETSFTCNTVPLPPGVKPVPVLMEPGDVLFFAGALVHGSGSNSTQDEFRRTLIGHYVEGNTTALTAFDQPVLSMDGRELTLEASPGGAPCGEWTNLERQPTLAMNGRLPNLVGTE